MYEATETVLWYRPLMVSRMAPRGVGEPGDMGQWYKFPVAGVEGMRMLPPPRWPWLPGVTGGLCAAAATAARDDDDDDEEEGCSGEGIIPPAPPPRVVIMPCRCRCCGGKGDGLALRPATGKPPPAASVASDHLPFHALVPVPDARARGTGRK